MVVEGRSLQLPAPVLLDVCTGLNKVVGIVVQLVGSFSVW